MKCKVFIFVILLWILPSIASGSKDYAALYPELNDGFNLIGLNFQQFMTDAMVYDGVVAQEEAIDADGYPLSVGAQLANTATSRATQEIFNACQPAWERGLQVMMADSHTDVDYNQAQCKFIIDHYALFVHQLQPLYESEYSVAHEFLQWAVQHDRDDIVDTVLDGVCSAEMVYDCATYLFFPVFPCTVYYNSAAQHYYFSGHVWQNQRDVLRNQLKKKIPKILQSLHLRHIDQDDLIPYSIPFIPFTDEPWLEFHDNDALGYKLHLLNREGSYAKQVSHLAQLTEKNRFYFDTLLYKIDERSEYTDLEKSLYRYLINRTMQYHMYDDARDMAKFNNLMRTTIGQVVLNNVNRVKKLLHEFDTLVGFSDEDLDSCVPEQYKKNYYEACEYRMSTRYNKFKYYGPLQVLSHQIDCAVDRMKYENVDKACFVAWIEKFKTLHAQERQKRLAYLADPNNVPAAERESVIDVRKDLLLLSWQRRNL